MIYNVDGDVKSYSLTHSLADNRCLHSGFYWNKDDPVQTWLK